MGEHLSRDVDGRLASCPAVSEERNCSGYAIKSLVQAGEERMLKGLRGLCEETKPIAEDANRIVENSSERGEPPCGVDPIGELVRIVGQTHDDPRSRNDAGAPRMGARSTRPGRPGRGMREFASVREHVFRTISVRTRNCADDPH
jgi:hypothetical protein